MGGGDLNLKKSWHPSTMKNMEKVWKAEQQDHQEKRRIAELKREIEMEKDREDMTKFAMEQGVIEKKDDKKLDWMYKGPNQSVNREDYLLGRPIDKPFEQMAKAEKDTDVNRAPKNHVEYECIPPSLRFFSGTEQVDLIRKQQEDPLYAIKKKEMETRSQLLKNPVKLKQLKQMLEEQAKKSKSDKKSRKKKSKKKSKIDSDDSNSDDDLDNLLAAKYNKLKNKISEKDLIKSVKKNKKEKSKRNRRSSSSSSEEEVEIRSKSKKKIRREYSSSEEEVETKSKSKKRNSRKNISSEEEEMEEKSEFKRKSRKRDSSEEDNTRGEKVKKKRRSRSNSEEKTKKHKHKKHHKHRSNSSNEEEVSESRNSRKSRKSRSSCDRRQNLEKHSMERRRSSSPKHKTESARWKEIKNEKHNVQKQNDTNDSSSDDDRKQFLKGSYGLVRADGTKILSSKAQPVEATKSYEKKKDEQRWVPSKREKLTEEEKERRRQEMMANASWRDKERERNVKRYREEENKEINSKTYNKDFIRKQLSVAAEVGTVESRIKANINNIQRSGRAMDTNFAKR